MTKQIQAILFDMGGTLRRTIDNDEGVERDSIRRIMELLGADGSVDGFAQLLSRRAKAYKGWAEKSLIELNENALWTEWMLPDWPVEQVSEIAIQLNQLYRESLGKRTIFPETQEVVLRLFRRGYRLGLVSNTTSSVEAPTLLKELGIYGCFETIVLSSIFGKRKPHPALLLQAARTMGIHPDRCAYVGDRPDRDVLSARKAGFAQTVLVQNGNGPIDLTNDPLLVPDFVIDNLNSLLELFPPRREDKRNKSQTKPTVYDVSFSTMWAVRNFSSLNDFFLAARRLGFAKIELNHQINSEMLERVDLKQVQFSSVHEPCPADISAEVLKQRDWLISSTDEKCRREGVKAIERSIDLAAKVGARTIVIHAGHISADRTIENQMRALFKAGRVHSDEYQILKDRLIKYREERINPGLTAVRNSLIELLDYASPYNIVLGLENRYHYLEFPGPDDLEVLLDLACPERLGVIYDVGHAQTFDRLEFYPHIAWLERFASRIIGVHLHDVAGITDHLAPGLGEVDFDVVAAYLPENAFRTCEIQTFNTPEQIKAGLKILSDRGCISNTKECIP